MYSAALHAKEVLAGSPGNSCTYRGTAYPGSVERSRSIIRRTFAQLEAGGLVKKTEGKGRELTPQGQKLLDASAHEILLELVKGNPDMGKY